jgi:hypothetical protein
MIFRRARERERERNKSARLFSRVVAIEKTLVEGRLAETLNYKKLNSKLKAIERGSQKKSRKNLSL